LLASALDQKFQGSKLLAVLVGSSLIIACGCVINNFIDRKIDIKMKRTSKRALVTKTITSRAALLFATVLGVLGFVTLLLFVNNITAVVGLVGLFFYLVPYSYFKRKSPIGTIVGSVSGATPIVAGYTAVTGSVDAGALLLFICMACWQMPHFYAIAMYRMKDYAAAGVPVLPVVKGGALTRIYIYMFIIAFVFSCCLLTLLGYTGYSFAGIMLLVCVWWVLRGLRSKKPDETWGKQMFLTSLVVLLVFCASVSVGGLLP
jgi:heme o synthase